MSVVEGFGYHHPPTCSIAGTHAKQDVVNDSFEALHPEFAPTDEWRELDKLENALRKLSRRYQFQHGPRLFGQPTCHHRPDVYAGIGEGEAATLLRDFFAARR